MDGDCGNYDLIFGYWDHCLYKDSSKPDYVALDWKTKHDQIWAEVNRDLYIGKNQKLCQTKIQNGETLPKLIISVYSKFGQYYRYDITMYDSFVSYSF